MPLGKRAQAAAASASNLMFGSTCWGKIASNLSSLGTPLTACHYIRQRLRLTLATEDTTWAPQRGIARNDGIAKGNEHGHVVSHIGRVRQFLAKTAPIVVWGINVKQGEGKSISRLYPDTIETMDRIDGPS